MPNQRVPANKSCPSVGNPVNPVLGIKVLDAESDFVFEGILPLRWSRSYFSDQVGTGWLGQGWSVPGVQRLEKTSEGMHYIDEQGSALALPDVEAGASPVFLPSAQLWVQRSGDTYVLASLDRSLSFTFTALRLPEGVHYPLTHITDRYGNQQCFIYTPNTALPHYIIDGNGRIFSLLFDTINAQQDTRLLSIALLAPGANLDEPQNLLHAQGEILVRYAYNDDGDLAQVIDRYGNLARAFSYRNHIMISHRDSAGFEAHYEYDVPKIGGKVLRHSTNLGEQWQFIYHPDYTEVIDTLGRREYYHFNEHQEFTRQLFADGSQSHNTRDEQGRVLSQTDRNGKTTHYTYTVQGQVSQITHPDGQTQRYEYDRQGRLVRETGITGLITQYEYDDKGSLIAEQRGNQRIAFRYTDKGLLSTLIDPLGNETHYQYNEANQRIAQTDCSGNRTEWCYTPSGQLSYVSDAEGNTTRYHYDNQQRLARIEYPDGSQEQFSYDHAHRLATYTDGNGSQTHYRYALDGLPTQRINALGNVFHYQYDPVRRLSALVNENQATYRFEYDEADRLIAESGFDGKYTAYHYQQGELVQQTISANRNSPPLLTHYFERDSLGRVIAHQAQAGNGNEHTRKTLAEYSYDEAHRLSLARNSESELQFEYDVLGRLVSQIYKKSDKTDRLQYRYDANGNRTQTQLPNGETIDYLYYGSGHLTAIKYNGSLISEFERDKLHREITRTQGRLTTNYELGPVGKLKAQLNAQIERHYHYDNAGNLTQSKDNLTQTTQYGYDKLGRLTHATSPLSRETFAFDPAHNIIEREEQKQQNNQVNHYHGTQYRYDGLGNLIERKLPTGEIQHYRYNLNDQLIEANITKVNGRTETWRYAYDPLGRRTDKRSETHKNLHTEFVWDGSHLLQEHNEQGTFTYLYTHPNSYEPLAQIHVAKNGEQQTAYYHCDQIGAPRELTDPEGQLLWHASYKGWGELQGEHNLKGVHQPLRLQNQYADKETGLHYNFFRYYDPSIGRFTTQDPIGLAGGENLYRFEGSIQNATDPLGLMVPLIPIAAPVLWGEAAVIGGGTIFAISRAANQEEGLKDVKKEQSCSKNVCPPCKTISGRIIPPKTIGYRPLDIIPDDKKEHGVYGSHHNIFQSNQAPYPNCRCFWSKQKYVLKPAQLTSNMVPVEPFIN